MKGAGCVAALILSGFAVACGDSRKAAPQMIEADGKDFYACKDTVYIDNEGGGLAGGETTFRIKFTDAAGLSHVIKGIKKLHVSDMSKLLTNCDPQ